MKTFGTIVADQRKHLGLSQKELAAQVKKEDGQAISPQYLNDIEHGRRNPPPENLIRQFAERLQLSSDMLCAAAGTLPADLSKIATTDPAAFDSAFKAFRKTVAKGPKQ